MYKIDADNNIELTRGDTFSCEVKIIKNDDPYTPEVGDTVRFAVKRKAFTPGGGNYADCEPLIEKAIPIDTLVLTLNPADTKGLKFGSYDYDIEITFEDGRVDTFIRGDFTLTPEVL